jgi:vacuolar-type H+-ATPase subunit F/Vma7
MSAIVAIGATHEIEGFTLTGVRVIPATTETEVTGAWNALDDDVGLVILSPTAAERLADELDTRPDVLAVVMP